MTALQRVTTALESHGLAYKATSRDTAMARCPCHDDRTPSLSLRQTRDRALIYCHAGCQTPDILAALELTPADLFDNRKEVTYTYPDGRVVHRKPDRSFYQSGDLGRSVLYVAPGLDLRGALEAGAPIFIPEGEQDVDTLGSMHVAAVTAPMGAANWAKCDYTPLSGARNLVIIQDKDEVGRQRANGLFHHLRSLGAEVMIVEAAVGKDVTDHIMAGRPLEGLVAVSSPTIGEPPPASEPPPGTPLSRVVLRSSREAMRPIRWAWRGVVPMGTLTICVGRGDVGKSTFVLWMAAQFQRGLLPGRLQGTGASILIVSQEDDWNAVTLPRLWANGAETLNETHTIHQMSVRVESGNGMRVPKLPLDIGLIEQALEQTGAQILIIDPLLSALGDGLSGDKTSDVRAAMDPLADLAMRHDVAVIGVAHVNKSATAVSIDRLSGSHAWRDAARAVLTFAKDEDAGITVITHGKGNYQQHKASYAYRMHSERVPLDEPDDEGNMWTDVGRVEFLGTTERTVDDVFTDEANQARTGDLSRDIAKFVRSSDHVVNTSEIEEAMSQDSGATAANVRQTLARLVKRGTIHRYGRGSYGPPPGMAPDPAHGGSHQSTRPAEFCSDCGQPLAESLIAQGISIHPTCGL